MQKNGFTLIELLVAMTVFIIVITGALNVFVSGFKQQGEVLDLIETLNNVSYISEYISRALRMAQKDINGACVAVPKNNFSNPGGASYVINFINYQGKCQQFSLEGGMVVVRKSSDKSAVNLGAAVPLSLTSLSISNLRFQIIGDGQTGQAAKEQPKVTFNLQAQKLNRSFGSISFQTTISQRQLDIAY